MHASVLAWFRTALSADEVRGKRVLEAGSYNVNGSVRPLVTALGPEDYIGVDASAGPDVDQVIDCTALIETFGASSWDVVISTEMLEHVEDWRSSIRNLIAVVAPGGLMMVTTRSPGFPYHPFPGDYWRYTAESLRRVFSNARLEILEIIEDPQDPGVFVKVRKPDDWQPQRGNPWVGVDVLPVGPQPQLKEKVMSEPVENKAIAALLRERAGLVAAGKTDRVALVDEQLKLRGYVTDEEPKREARKQPPQGRSSKPPQASE